MTRKNSRDPTGRRRLRAVGSRLFGNRIPTKNMSSIWHSLIWKEWHEHKWKLASIVVILLGVTALAMASSERDRFGLAYSMMFLCIVPLSIFIGLGTAAGERSRGTLPFLQSLPVSMRHVALTQLVAGLMTVVFPVVLAVFGFFLWRLGLDNFGVAYRDLSKMMVEDMSPVRLGNWYLNAAVICGGIGGSLFLWSAATGVNRKDEISAGAKALSIMIGWSAFLAFVVWTFAGDVVTPLFSWLVTISLSLAPGAAALFIGARELTQTQFVLAAWITAVVHVLLAAFYVQRFGQIAEREIVSPRQAVPDARRYDWLAPPRRSSLSAIAWKQFRESGPIALVGLAGTVALVACVALSEFATAGRILVSLGMVYARVAAVVGFCVAMVVGIGVCVHDVKAQLNTFWRSRPIHPDSWYWCKYSTGLAVVLASVYGPIILMLAVGNTSVLEGVNIPEAIVIPWLHVAVFAAAVAMTCLVRQAVYAAILSIALMYSFVVATWAVLLAAGKLRLLQTPPESLGELSEAQVTAGLMICFGANTVLAWLAVRYDWGRKSRY